jgi:hypothetical protein
MARYKVASPLGYFGPTGPNSSPSLHPQNSIIELADDAPCSLYWIALDAAAAAAIAREQARQAGLRQNWTKPENWSAWGGCLPHGTGAVAERTDGGPPTENWPPDAA